MKITLNKKIYIILFILFIFTYLSLSGLLYYQKIDREEHLMDRNLKQLQNEIDVILSSYNVIAELSYNNIVNTSEVKEIIYNALHDRVNRDQYRNELINKFDEFYKELNSYNVRQFHFHFKDGTSFLRMHKPNKFGDNLFNVRDTVKYVNQKKQKTIGFEEGKIFNGYRYVFPLNFNDEHIGSVEISISYFAVAELLKEKFSKSSTFILEKEVIKGKIFSNEISNYNNSECFKKYLYDKEFLSLLKNNQDLINYDFIVEYNKKNKEVINDKLEEQENFTIIEEINDKYYVANFINIKNFNQEPVGYFVIYNESKMINYLNRNFKVMCIVLTLSFIFISGLILKLFANNKRLNYLAKRDRLTGVYNRHKIEEILNLELNRANRYDLKFSILILDIDYFKEVNDTYGHNKGDQVLKQMCNLIGKNIRDADTLGRWGGEEFIIIAPETNIDKSFQLANKLRKIISQYNFIKDKKVTVSIGLAEYENNYSIDEIISRADQALYKAKNNGRNRAEKF